jgi:hypothetical protein
MTRMARMVVPTRIGPATSQSQGTRRFCRGDRRCGFDFSLIRALPGTSMPQILMRASMKYSDRDGIPKEDGTEAHEEGMRGFLAIFATFVPSSCHLRSTAIDGRCHLRRPTVPACRLEREFADQRS